MRFYIIDRNREFFVCYFVGVSIKMRRMKSKINLTTKDRFQFMVAKGLYKNYVIRTFHLNWNFNFVLNRFLTTRLRTTVLYGQPLTTPHPDIWTTPHLNFLVPFQSISNASNPNNSAIHHNSLINICPNRLTIVQFSYSKLK